MSFKKPEDLFLQNLQWSKPQSFDAIKISIASPEKIRSWSYGEVKKPDTINYRTLKPEKDGLFCAKIFGPVKNFFCICGKYKKVKHKGIICEKCGVEVTLASVRRERMGHIELAAPVVHVWFLRSLPSRIGVFLDISLRSLEKILYFESYVVIDGGMTEVPSRTILTLEEHEELVAKHGDEIITDTGASAIRKLLQQINIEREIAKISNIIRITKSDLKLKKNLRRIQVLENFKKSGNKPEWMVLTVLPVLAPDLRPLVPIEGGRFATSDANDLYRRVINRNNRLKSLIDLQAPVVILRNEIRMLQEAVDALFDNGRHGRLLLGSNKRPLKSLAEGIRGKKGRFRQNLLGKRVDYSGRSVIAVGPTLKLHQCGLPKEMALELFRPFLYSKLINLGHAVTIKSAKQMVEERQSIVWDLLEKIIFKHPVLLNRAPTLHRMGIQAFEPKLIDGKAIQLHPLACSAFNADFDGDQMAVHVPLSIEAQLEARVLMLATNNLLSPATGEPIVTPTKDIILGLYVMSLREDKPIRHFNNVLQVKRSLDLDLISINAPIIVKINDISYETTVGRVLVSEILPKGMDFSLINTVLDKKQISKAVQDCYSNIGHAETVSFLDNLLKMGIKYSTSAAVSVSIADICVPEGKQEIIRVTEDKIRMINQQFNQGLLTKKERFNKNIEAWSIASEEITSEILSAMSPLNPIAIMANSGARGSISQIRQLCGMRGLMSKPNGSIIETPIKASFKEGLSSLEYFTSTHGARKGLADTALQTANAGYLYRRLVDIAQDLVLSLDDCKTKQGISFYGIKESSNFLVTLGTRIMGRVLVQPINTPFGIIPDGVMLTKQHAEIIDKSNVMHALVRSPVTCQTVRGVCKKCYGADLTNGKEIRIGESIGIIAAQSIGEPGTQLTLRTFHSGGAASLSKSAQEDLTISFEGTMRLHAPNVIVDQYGNKIVGSRRCEIVLYDVNDKEVERHHVPRGAKIFVDENFPLAAGTKISQWDAQNEQVIAEASGYIKYVDIILGSTMNLVFDPLTGLSIKRIMPLRKLDRKDVKPRLCLVDAENNPVFYPNTSTPVEYLLQKDTIIAVEDSASVLPGDILAQHYKESANAGDIIGGLPRITDIFEARCPKDPAVLAEQEGCISFGKETKGKIRLQITPEQGDPLSILVNKNKNIVVLDGETVEKGDIIVEGTLNPHDILRMRGIQDLSVHFIDGIQRVYINHGVGINDKHLEVILRQMLRRVNITFSPIAEFIEGETVELAQIIDTNQILASQGKEEILYERVLLGITRGALTTESFLSAASFQETTRILTEASMNGQIDRLRGLKENVLIGRLIPAGTGMPCYRKAHHGDAQFNTVGETISLEDLIKW